MQRWVPVLVWASLLSPAATAAQSTTGTVPASESQEELEAAARQHFFDGATLYEEGDYEAALAKFQASAELRGVPVVYFNIAQTLRALFRYAEAIAMYRRYLEEGGDRITAARRREVRRTIEQLRRRLAPVTLLVEPAGTEIRIDGRLVGTAPLDDVLVLSAGRRRMELSADGYLPIRDDLEVAGGEPRTIRLRLARRETAGTVTITSAPREAAVRIDGLEVGAAPVSRRLPAGGHVVEADADGYETYRASIDLADRQELALHLVLDEDTDPITSRWWFWAGAGALVVGATVAVVLLAQPSEPDPFPGNSHPSVVQTLRAF